MIRQLIFSRHHLQVTSYSYPWRAASAVSQVLVAACSLVTMVGMVIVTFTKYHRVQNVSKGNDQTNKNYHATIATDDGP